MSSNQVAVSVGMNFPGEKLFRHWLFISFLVFYGALLFSQTNHGLSSGDGHGIVRSTRLLVENHSLEVSRPPGHPVTEFYLFGAAGWVLKQGFGYKFDDTAYLVLQALVALATLVVFYELLCRLGAAAWRALLGTACLGFSAQYFSNAIDGEEFVFALFFLLVSVRLLIVPPDSLPKLSRLLLSICCFALATGCRPEIIFAGLIFPIYCLLHPKLGWKYAVATLPMQAAMIFVVWLPVLFVGLRAPYTAGMNLRESILGGGYKLLFQSFTPPVFLLLCWIVICGLGDLRRRLQRSFPDNFLFVVSCSVPVIFFIVFFLHASKAAHVLVVLPFLLLLTMERSNTLLVSLAAVTLIGYFVNIDIFQDRQLTRPFLVPGAYFQAVHQKPYYKLNYLADLFEQCENGPAVIIGNAWPWDFEYHMVHTTDFLVREEMLHGQIKRDIPAFFSPGDSCIFLPPDAVYEKGLLEEWQRKGYAMKMDAKLYRTLFARYDIRSAFSAVTADVEGISFNLFRID